MKRTICLLLTVALALSLAACGRAAQEDGGQSSAVASGSASQSALQPEVSSAAEPEASAAAPEEQSSMAEPEQSSSDVEVEAVPTIEVETVEDNRVGEDGTELLDFTYDQATVTVPGNEAATAAIQAGLDALTADIQSLAEEYAAIRQEDEFVETPYYLNQELTVSRLDSQVISLQVRVEQYQGGAHGGVVYTGLTYDVATGAKLTLEDLGSGVKESAVETVTALADAISADLQEGFFFEGYQEDIPIAVVTDDFFYLTEDGIMFVDNEYCLQAYAAGTVFFGVGYGDLMGALDDRFALPGAGSTAVLSDGSVYTMDGRLDDPNVG